MAMIDIETARGLADDFHKKNYYAEYVHEQAKRIVARLDESITKAASGGSYAFCFKFCTTKVYIDSDVIIVREYADENKTLLNVMATVEDILKDQGFKAYSIIICHKDDIKEFRVSWYRDSFRDATNEEMAILAKKYNDMKSLADNKDTPLSISRIAVEQKNKLEYHIQHKIWTP